MRASAFKRAAGENAQDRIRQSPTQNATPRTWGMRLSMTVHLLFVKVVTHPTTEASPDNRTKVGTVVRSKQ